jgi:hypothetical protein
MLPTGSPIPGTAGGKEEPMNLSVLVRAAKRLDDEIRGAIKINGKDGRRTINLPFGRVTADVSTGSRNTKNYEGAIEAGNIEIRRLSNLLSNAGVAHKVREIEVEDIPIPVCNIKVVEESIDDPTAKRINALELPMAMALAGFGLDKGKLKQLGFDEKVAIKAIETAPSAEVTEKVGKVGK